MLSSNYMIEMPSGKRIRVHVSEKTLLLIMEEVRKNKSAMLALQEGMRRHKEAMARGDISSPPAPDEYSIIYNIMNKHDPRYAGTLGSEIIVYLQDRLMN